MRLLLLFCLCIYAQASSLAFSPPSTENYISANPSSEKVVSDAVMLSLAIDSLHQINCLRSKGYLSVIASGGVTPYTYTWSNGTTGPLDANLDIGSYDISVVDGNGAMVAINVVITSDLTPPTSNAGVDFTAPCANSVLTLSGSGSVGAEFRYLWTGSNGGVIQSGGTTLSPVIKHTGTFTLVVSNIINGCTASSAINVAATNQPPVITATGGTVNCIQPAVTLGSTYPSSNVIFQWNGPSGYLSYAPHPSVSLAGNYIFKVTDTLTTCLNTATAIVVLDTVKPVFAPTGGTLTCTQPFLTISGTPTPLAVNFNWSGPLGFSSMLQNPVVNVAGTYNVTVTNPASGCTARKTAVVTSNFATPMVSTSVGSQLTCVNAAVQIFASANPSTVTYSWTGPAGYTSMVQNPTVNAAGTYTVTVRSTVNGCTATATATVVSNTAPPGATAVGGIKTCSNPVVTILATSPTSGVTFKWSGPGGFNSTLPNPSVSTTGAYSVTITNPVNGCTSVASTSVTQNMTPPNVSATTATISCYTPAPHVSASSTTNGATFSWTGPNGFTSNISNPAVTVSGSYTVTATSPVNGCTNSTSIFVGENLATPIVYAGEDRSLNCNFTSILANPIGTSTGTNITYLWTTWDGHIFSGANTLYARFDATGHYTLTVKNTQSGCMVLDSMEVTQTPPLTANATQLNGVSCNGGNNGSAIASPVGGALSYTFNWSTGVHTATVSNLSAGSYTVTITDSEGCSATGSVTITQPGVLAANVSATPQTINGVNNGSATVTPTGGAAPYSVKWSNNATSLTIMNLAPGNYTVTVTDNNGCTKSNVATVNAVSCTITGETSVTNLQCAGANTGSATANVSNAPTPFTYAWSNGAQTKTASNLAAGTYTVTVTSSNGCSTVLMATLTAPQPLVLTVGSKTNVTCFGGQNGAATVGATGGTAPYLYLWSSGSTASSISNLAAGTYTCTTTDAHGCTATTTAQITTPLAITVAVSNHTDVACNDGQNGAITVNATGGSIPFNYTWSNNNAGATISNLGTGTYTCTVSDANGCTKTTSTSIVATDHTGPQLVLQNASAVLNSNGTATVTPAMFDNGSFDQTCSIVSWTVSPTTFDCSQVGARTVTLTATDKNGNTSTGTAIATVTDNQAPLLICPSNLTASACASTVTFNQPQVQDNCSATNQITLVSGLPSGSSFPVGVTQQNYSYTDNGGNTATCQFTVTVSSSLNIETSVTPATCSGNCDGSATLSVTSGGSPSSVLWSTGQTTLQIAGLCPGSYTATLTDNSGCTQTYVAQIQTNDTQPPLVICPANVVRGYCNTVATFPLPQVLDNCATIPQQIQLISGFPSGSNFPIGVTVETFQYTDGGGNTGECNFTVTVNSAASVNLSATPATCNGACDGSATVDVSGGQGPFGILWSHGAAGPVVANLCSGLYTATVTDVAGCTQLQSVAIGQPQPISIGTPTVTNDIGSHGNGSITINVSGGVMPYTYSWTMNGQAFASTKNLTGLFAGTYVVAITDAHGCVFTSTPITVTGSVPTVEPGENLGWEIYPNPAKTAVFVQLNGEFGQHNKIALYNTSGQLLLEKEVESAGGPMQIDLETMPAGLIMARLTTENGTFSKMIVKSGQ